MENYNSTGTSYGMQSNEDFDASRAAHIASQQAGDSGDHSFFSSILSSLTSNAELSQSGGGGQQQQHHQQQEQYEEEQEPYGHLDQGEMIKQHQNFFGDGNGNEGAGEATSGGLGAAAAIQALKLFTGAGGSSQQQQQQSQGHGNSQNAFVGMAMGEAAKLFESQYAQGNTQSGVTKNSVVEQAGKMALKMYLRGQGGGLAGSGLLGGLAGKSI